VGDDASPGPEPGESTLRLAMEQYIRYRLLDEDQCTDGWYTRLRSFVEWCERVGIDSVDSLCGSDLAGYYEYRRPDTAESALEDLMRTIDEFCQFLDDVGAIEGDELVATSARLRDQLAADPVRSDGSGPESRPQNPISRWVDRGTIEDPRVPTTRTVEYDIETTESVSSAIVRAVSAVDGRPQQYMPPLSNVVDPTALDDLFAARSQGVPRTGGHLSIVYGSCRVVLESDEYLRVTPLETVSGIRPRTDRDVQARSGSTAGSPPHRNDRTSNGND
jgi:hypothetical protein